LTRLATAGGGPADCIRWCGFQKMLSGRQQGSGGLTMKRAALLLALTTAGLTGCAALSFSRQPDPREQLNQGVVALEAQDYAAARALLEPLYRERWQEPVGQ